MQVGLPRFERLLEFRVPPHQVVLSFDSDSDSDLFYTWWNTIGKYHFKEWGLTVEPTENY